MKMNHALEIIHQIRNTSSTNEKLSILKANKDNELLQRVLKYCYDSNLKYGITEEVIKPYIVIDTTYSISTDSMFEHLDLLAKSNINDSLRILTGEKLGGLDEDERELFLQILTKDLRCNISDKTISKVWKDILPQWEVQQAYSIDKYKLKANEWIAISEKLNGSRGSFMNGEIKSRQNKVFNGLDHIISDINSLGMDEYFIDGELIRDNVDNIPDNENFRLSLSILASDDIDKKDIVLKVYDIMPKDEFISGESKLKYPDRIKQLEQLSDKINEIGVSHIKVLPILYQGKDHTQIEKWLDYADSNNWEGCMLYRDTTYKCKRHSGILKVKSFKHCDVKCLRIFEGEGRLKGTLGGIIVDYKGFECGVGTGFDDATRNRFWNHPDEIVGRVVQIKYKEESKNKQDGLSMQFPVFECVRESGKDVSYN